MRFSISIGGLALLAASCGKELNPNYCIANPVDEDCRALDDGGMQCTSNAQCPSTAPVCDTTGSLTCVECLPDQAGACTGATPACGDDHTCRACAAHSECPASEACLPDGACADEGDVAYVGGPGATDNDSCTKAMPCTKVSKALARARDFVKFTGTIDEGGIVTIDNQNVTLLASPGAKLVRTSNGIVLEVKGTSEVAIYDLEISGGSGAQGIGISLPAGNTAALTLTRATITGNQGGGITASGGSLTVSQSTISLNGGGGISISNAEFDLTNNFIIRNGNDATSTFGGVSLNFASVGTNRLEFNTIVDNEAAVNSGGVICSVGSFTGPNNIIARNKLAGVSTSQTSGPCTYPSSKIQDDVSGLAFIDPDAPAPFIYKVAAGSTAIDQAVTSSTIDVDHEGDDRPQGNGKDIGADELAP